MGGIWLRQFNMVTHLENWSRFEVCHTLPVGTDKVSVFLATIQFSSVIMPKPHTADLSQNMLQKVSW